MNKGGQALRHAACARPVLAFGHGCSGPALARACCSPWQHLPQARLLCLSQQHQAAGLSCATTARSFPQYRIASKLLMTRAETGSSSTREEQHGLTGLFYPPPGSLSIACSSLQHPGSAGKMNLLAKGLGELQELSSRRQQSPVWKLPRGRSALSKSAQAIQRYYENQVLRWAMVHTMSQTGQLWGRGQPGAAPGMPIPQGQRWEVLSPCRKNPAPCKMGVGKGALRPQLLSHVGSKGRCSWAARRTSCSELPILCLALVDSQHYPTHLTPGIYHHKALSK